MNIKMTLLLANTMMFVFGIGGLVLIGWFSHPYAALGVFAVLSASKIERAIENKNAKLRKSQLLSRMCSEYVEEIKKSRKINY